MKILILSLITILALDTHPQQNGNSRSLKELATLIKSANESIHIEECKSGSPRDCVIIALKYQLNENHELAFDYLKLACDVHDDGIGCFSLYIYYDRSQDRNLSIHYLNKACSLNIGDACFELVFEKAKTICGDLVSCTYYDFSESPKHRDELRKLIRKACHLGHDKACRLLR